jgi:transcriptional regulator with XRE-family HTH domain
MSTGTIDCEWPIAQKVRALRLAAGLTQREAAELVGLGAPARWSDYESGRHQIDAIRWLVFLLLTDQHPTHRLAARN